jgi:predicted nucleic acid-binding protein
VTLVVDASTLTLALAADTELGDRARAALHGQTLTAPEIIDLEVVSALRRNLRAGTLDERRAARAVAALRTAPIARVRHVRLVQRCWELRGNLTAYDAAYAALAEGLRAPLLTADAALAHAPGLPCQVQLI